MNNDLRAIEAGIDAAQRVRDNLQQAHVLALWQQLTETQRTKLERGMEGLALLNQYSKKPLA